MTDEEIIKTLEGCCIRAIPPCTTCKYDKDTITCDKCMGELMKDALDLINRQKAEIEQLKQLKNKRGLVAQVTINERELNEIINNQVERIEYNIKEIENEARKEFAEKLKSKFGKENILRQAIVHAKIDRLLEEMEGGTNEA